MFAREVSLFFLKKIYINSTRIDLAFQNSTRKVSIHREDDHKSLDINMFLLFNF